MTDVPWTGSIRHVTMTAWVREVPTPLPPFLQYGVFGREVCPSTGREHLQCHVVFKDKQYFAKAKRLLGPVYGHDIHLEKCQDSAASVAYCKKQGRYTELGTLLEPGRKRKEPGLSSAIGDALNQSSFEAAEQFLKDNFPNEYLKHGEQMLRNLQRHFQPAAVRDSPLIVTWLYGPAGYGKDNLVRNVLRENHPGQSVYYLNMSDNGFWTGYTNQEVVVISDFRDSRPLCEVLKWLDPFDVYPVKRKFLGTVPMVARYMYITAPQPPDAYYQKRAQDGDGNATAQLMRRIARIYVFDAPHNVVLKKNEVPARDPALDVIPRGFLTPPGPSIDLALPPKRPRRTVQVDDEDDEDRLLLEAGDDWCRQVEELICE
jgi:hypothetical protein